MDEIKKHLDKKYATVDRYWENTTTELQETDFNESTTEYMKLANDIVQNNQERKKIS